MMNAPRTQPSNQLLFSSGAAPELGVAASLYGALIGAWDVDVMGIVPQARAVQGSASSAILDAAADASLVVVGARGHPKLPGSLLGSVSDQVVHHATCPVVVVP